MLLKSKNSVARQLIAGKGSLQARQISRHLQHFATLDPKTLSPANKCMNLVEGEWTGVDKYFELVDPMTGKPMISVPETSMQETEPFIDSLWYTPKTGLHNPFKNKERYIMLGEVCRKTAEVLHEKETFDFFVDSIMRCAPKSRKQTEGEVRVTRAFFENFSGD